MNPASLTSIRPRFAANIRFVTSQEWEQLGFEDQLDAHEVGKDGLWHAGDGDQFVLKSRSYTAAIGPCVSGGLTGKPSTDAPASETPRQVGQFHLLPKWHLVISGQRIIGTKLGENVAGLKHSLEGLVLGGRPYADSLRLALWMIGAVGGLLGRIPTHFIQQGKDSGTSLAFEGKTNTWFVCTLTDADPHGLQSLDSIKRTFKRRFVAPGDEIFIGLTSTMPIDKSSLAGIDY